MQFATRGTLARGALAGALLALGLGACADAARINAPAAAEQVPGQRLAKSIARALADAGLRADLRDALRDSRYNEHKLLLQEFVATPAGQKLVSASAHAAGVTPATVKSWIAGLPQMDFYVPLAQHRRNWSAGVDLVVGLNMDVNDTKLTGYAPDGTVRQLDARDGVPTSAVLLLTPAEPKVFVDPADRRPGGTSVIEPNEPDGPRLTMINPYCSDAEPCSGDTGTGGTGGTTGYTGGVLYRFKNYYGDGWGGIELMVKHYESSNGVKVGNDEIMEEGGGCFAGLFGCYPEWSYPQRNMAMASTGFPFIRVWERDAGSEDDFWGEMYFQGYGVLHRFTVTCSGMGSDTSGAHPECDPTYPGWMFNRTATVDIYYAHKTNGTYDQG